MAIKERQNENRQIKSRSTDYLRNHRPRAGYLLSHHIREAQDETKNSDQHMERRSKALGCLDLRVKCQSSSIYHSLPGPSV